MSEAKTWKHEGREFKACTNDRCRRVSFATHLCAVCCDCLPGSASMKIEEAERVRLVALLDGAPNAGLVMAGTMHVTPEGKWKSALDDGPFVAVNLTPHPAAKPDDPNGDPIPQRPGGEAIDGKPKPIPTATDVVITNKALAAALEDMEPADQESKNAIACLRGGWRQGRIAHEGQAICRNAANCHCLAACNEICQIAWAKYNPEPTPHPSGCGCNDCVPAPAPRQIDRLKEKQTELDRAAIREIVHGSPPAETRSDDAPLKPHQLFGADASELEERLREVELVTPPDAPLCGHDPAHVTTGGHCIACSWEEAGLGFGDGFSRDGAALASRFSATVRVLV